MYNMCFDLKTCVCTRTSELDSRLDWMKIRMFINGVKIGVKNMMKNIS